MDFLYIKALKIKVEGSRISPYTPRKKKKMKLSAVLDILESEIIPDSSTLEQKDKKS